jgi:mannose-6-phosphate isomerase class I
MYDRLPYIAVGDASECTLGWARIAEQIRAQIQPSSRVCIECYPGVDLDEIERGLLQNLGPATFCRTESLFCSAAEIESRVQPYLTDDPVFGRMNSVSIADFFDQQELRLAQERLRQANKGLLIVLGTGASLVCPDPDLLILADLARWEIQMRQRHNIIGNLGARNLDESASLKYKRAFFVDWRAADRLKREIFGRINLLLDTNIPGEPKLVTADGFRRGLALAARRPFRVVPFFDPGPWGGHWMERVCGLPEDGAPNHAWCFDCVPEENSLLLGFGDSRVEVPAVDLVFLHPQELLGANVYSKFGAEFPIRFDLLDTVGGGNLSLQVHPLTEYIRQKFGMDYTQDESYYMLDAAPGACVYLGLKDGIDSQAMVSDLRRSQEAGAEFPVEAYVNRFPAHRHDHFLIPAGTVHCSGKNSMVLEISATPFIFTFKLWDWGRLGLNGAPRPIHLQDGIANIQWNRTAAWVGRSLINRLEPIAAGDGWREERTGLHALEFIETRRHWFTGTVPHNTQGTVQVLNLVEGEEVVVESPTQAFDAFVVHYAETFIVPASVGAYTIRPHGISAGKECATILAHVRDLP